MYFRFYFEWFCFAREHFVAVFVRIDNSSSLETRAQEQGLNPEPGFLWAAGPVDRETARLRFSGIEPPQADTERICKFTATSGIGLRNIPLPHQERPKNASQTPPFFKGFSAHSFERFVLAYPVDPLPLVSPSWEETLVNLD
ncbi:hypothetical protein DSO57_1033826 [Entomophthora muscae]|uniref:Uncharacterized protein n=1 Tax=Entomophthora muscae TaxID=34485 RepID=A0ACC2U9Y5_9FUNG|nr:hypothetical protein DSO57_1033826 [Entomophthora muscae]